jgi:hypothetical protein
VCIICPTHGEFWQTPHDHLVGGCKLCGYVQGGLKTRLTQEDFIIKAESIHGNKYDYSKVEYVNHKTKACIICPIHGEFWQTPNRHLHGQGCPSCGIEKQHNHPNLYTTEEYKEKIRQIHGDKYILDKVEYYNLFTKHIITCPIHGDFEALPTSLLQGHGCAKCAFEKNSQARLHSIEWFKERAIEIHGDKYDYSQVEYKGFKRKVTIKCNKCGHIFQQTPNGHIGKQGGCPKCRFSKLEMEMEKCLQQLNIEYIIQYPIGRQRLDFYLPRYNIAIECQGEQHFRNKFFFSHDKTKNEENYYKSLERDWRKWTKCQELGMDVLYYTRGEFLHESVWNMGIYNKNNTFSSIDDIIKYINDVCQKG